MRYQVYLEAEPTPESYRLSHQPRPGYAPVFICPFVVLTDSAGQLYNAMRGVQGQNKNETMNMGVYGRYPSFARLMKNARIKDQLLVFDELRGRDDPGRWHTGYVRGYPGAHRVRGTVAGTQGAVRDCHGM